MLAPPPYGTDVELCCTNEAYEKDLHGEIGTCTLAKIGFFIEQEGDPSQGQSKEKTT